MSSTRRSVNTKAQLSFYKTVTAAVSDIIEHGYDNQSRVEDWTRRIREAAERDLTPHKELEAALVKNLKATFNRMVNRNQQILQFHPNVPEFAISNVMPKLRSELDRRVMSSANIIKLNRERAIEETVQRYQGWATSIPPGGTKVAERLKIKKNISASLKKLPFKERRVIVDQSHKMVANLNEIIAIEGNAIAAKWHSNWREPNYDYRLDHKERDEKIYAIRGSYALKNGWMNKGAGYTDDMTKPGEEPNCQCFETHLYILQDLPARMLTKKGKDEIARVAKLRKPRRRTM